MELNKLKDEVHYRPSRLISVTDTNSRSGSDMELGYDSNDEIRRSSPQDNKNSKQYYNQMVIKPDNLLLGQHSYDEGESLNCSSSSGVSDNNCILATMPKMNAIAQNQFYSVHSEAESNQAPNNHPLMGHPNSSLIFHASGLGPWYKVIAYDACVRLCLKSWAKGYNQAVLFLDNECKLLRDAFSLSSTLLQSEEEVLSKHTSELVSQVAAPRHTKTVAKLKVQVRKVKMFLEPSFGCKRPHFHLKSFQYRLSNVKSRLSNSIRNRAISRKGFEYKQIGDSSKNNGSPSSSLSNETVQGAPKETFSCLMRLKSADEDDMVQMQPGLDETHTFSPENLEDDLHIIVEDSKGRYCGQVLAQLASVAENSGEKISWWPIYDEPDKKPVGKLQLFIGYSTSQDNSSHHKCCLVTETVAYDVVLETAMKAQGLKPRNLELNGHWKWLVDEFAAFYGVSNSYTKLRYLSYVMEIATPTSDCLSLVLDLISSIISCGSRKQDLSHKENRVLGEVLDKLEQILSVVFENYKSLDESSCLGLVDGFGPPTGLVGPALTPAVKLYTLIHDEFSSEAQLKLCRYFQAAAKKRSGILLKLANDRLSSDNSTGYLEMKSLCLSMKDEVYTDKEIQTKNVLPSYIDLPNITSAIYNMDLQTKVCTFLKSYPPNSPSRPIIEFIVTLADFQRDISSWNINPIKEGLDANELFGRYISNWIKDTRLTLLGLCVKDKACNTTNWPDVRTQTMRTNPFIDDMFDQLKNTITVYEDIITRFPNFALPLEKAIADVQNAVVEALERYYADFVSPLKEHISRFGFKHVQRLTKRAEIIYIVPTEVGVLLNSMRRMIHVLCPKIEFHVKSWSCYVCDDGNVTIGESIGEATITLRAKFRNYMQGIIEKAFNNTRAQSSTRWKKIVEDLKDKFLESDIESRLEPLSDLISNTLTHLHSVFDTQVFLAICWGLWDRFGKEVLYALEMSKENKSWYRGSRVALTIVDGVFVSQMQLLVGNALEEKDVKPPRSVLEAHSVLSKDFVSYKDSIHYY